MNALKKILITGADGQVGNALQLSAPDGYIPIVANKSALDISNRSEVLRWVETEKPAGIINAAAFTAVDRAESESDLAFRVNAEGPLNLALAAQGMSISLVHISTDFVFDGRQSTPYKPGDTVNPLSVYGESKARGEAHILSTSPEHGSIIRTSWVYSMGYANFVSTMLRLMSEKDRLTVVADQIGTPTSAQPLALACWAALERRLSGIFHWTDAGVASWYDFAVAIQEESLQLGILKKAIPVLPIDTDQFPTPATRPSYSVLEKAESSKSLGQSPDHWRIALRRNLATMA